MCWEGIGTEGFLVMEYLVTGGAGFIGSNIVRKLLADGKSVRVLDNLATGRIENINDLLKDIDFIQGDVRNEDDVRKSVLGVENVLHLAALPSVLRSVEDPITSDSVNVSGTVRMLMASRDAGVARFVVSSSSSVYGDTPTLPKREDMEATPLSPYAVQKLTCEYYCGIFYRLYGLKTFSLRYFNVYGPRQNPGSQYAAVVPLFIDAILNGKRPVIYGDGEQTRDFTFVDDVVAANICCCGAEDSAVGGVYNISCGQGHSVLDLARLIAKMAGRDVEPEHQKARPGDVRDSQGDSSKALKFLKWRSRISLEEGLKSTLDYMKE